MSVDLTTFERAARSASASFRLGMDAQANDALVHLVDALLLLPEAGALSATVGDLLGAQVRGDTLHLADLIEFELLPRLLRSESPR